MREYLLQMREYLLQIWSCIWSNASDIEAIISIGCALFSCVIWLTIKIQNRSVNRYLRKWLTKDAMHSLRYYIATTGQQIDPCENEEIGETNECKITKKLVPFFIKEVFKNKVQNQYFAILGDSGMGKTTFMIQLFKSYKRKFLKKYRIEFLPLSYQICLSEINNIKKPESTILLLDGLDENPDALENYDMFMEELLKATQGFYKVVITCRTQFFPNKQSEPYEVGYIRIPFNMNNKKNRFYKIYVSPFEEKDIMHFLRKKYPFLINAEKRKRAWRVISKSPYLMVRPMLLSYIDDLIQGDNEYRHIYQIYEQLTGNWMRRENIPYLKLCEFTRITARHMYENNSNHIKKDEISAICKRYEVNLREIEAKSRSLLNRNGIGDYKFAHKSIYEYFLAKEAMENVEFREIMDFSKLNMAELFFREMSDVYIDEELLENTISGDFTAMALINKDFSQKRIENAVFRMAQIQNCNFSNCNLRAADVTGCTFSHCDLSKARLDGVEQVGISFINCEMTGLRFAGATCNKVRFNKCSLPLAVFSKSVCEDMDYNACNMQGAHFENSIVIRGTFMDTDLRGANLKEVSINQSSFIRSNFAFSKLSGAIINRNCIFNSVIWAPIAFDNIQAPKDVLEEITVANLLANVLINK